MLEGMAAHGRKETTLPAGYKFIGEWTEALNAETGPLQADKNEITATAVEVAHGKECSDEQDVQDLLDELLFD